jgi:hypothetical protein
MVPAGRRRQTSSERQNAKSAWRSKPAGASEAPRPASLASTTYSNPVQWERGIHAE